MSSPSNDLVQLSHRKFLAFCAFLAAGFFAWGFYGTVPAWIIAAEVFLTIITLFVTGSIKYRLDKNALTYGAGLVIVATFWAFWAPAQLAAGGLAEKLGDVAKHHFLSFHGLDNLIHLDTLLFILGLTYFVAMVAQTRLLETISFGVLSKTNGNLLVTVAALTGIVSLASGILDGVSMIGLMIRTLVILLLLAKVKNGAVVYAVMISTIVTTVCGMWLAYGEPPNLIMKSNLHPHLDNAFFLRYCAPAAFGTFLIVFFNLRRRLQGKRVDLGGLDILDRHTADVRFLQVTKQGEMLTPLEFAQNRRDELDRHFPAVERRLLAGVPLGEAMVNEGVPKPARVALLSDYLDARLAETLDDYYVHVFGKSDGKAKDSAGKLEAALDAIRRRRTHAQRIGGLAFLPFVGLLIAHAINHDIPLFVSSITAFFCAAFAVWSIPKMRRLALHGAWHEFREYLFLIPLFLSISLLQKTGFFNQLTDLLHHGIDKIGAAHVAYGQFWFATILSALLDNNVVADFAGRAIQGFEVSLIHLFAMAQIAGYALGGCWTHIGSAQSVVAYSYIQKEVDARYTPFQWIKEMTPVVLQIAVWMTLVVYGEGFLRRWMG